jgi:hypothetical protein
MELKSMSRALGALLLLVSFWGIAPVRAAEDPWADFRFLIGTWVNGGKPEEGTGGFSFAPDVQGKVLVRRNHADLPARKDRPAAKHEDLMIVYRGPDGQQVKASYFDNEEHVIQYNVSPLPDRKGLVFVSEAEAAAPRFRLTYTKSGEDTVAIKFEFAPPGEGTEFKLYLEGSARRAKSGL